MLQINISLLYDISERKKKFFLATRVTKIYDLIMLVRMPRLGATAQSNKNCHTDPVGKQSCFGYVINFDYFFTGCKRYS